MSSVICSKCKTANREGSVFCFNCGAKIEKDLANESSVNLFINSGNQKCEVPVSEPPAVLSKCDDSAKVTPKRSKSFLIKLISLITVAVLVTALIVTGIVIRVVTSQNIRDTVDNYVEAVFIGDLEKTDDLMPEKYKSQFKKSIKEYGTTAEKAYRSRSAEMDKRFGNNIKITYNVLDLERVESFNEFYYLDMLEANHNINDVNLDAVYRVKFYVEFSGDKSDKTYNFKMAALKIDGEWYLFDLNNKCLAYESAYRFILDFDELSDKKAD